MTKHRVKVTKEILAFFTNGSSLLSRKTIEEGGELQCVLSGDSYAWFCGRKFVFQAKLGDHYDWDKAFTEWLRKNYPEELI